MSWILRQRSIRRQSYQGPYEHEGIESSEMREAIGLKWFLDYGDERLAPEKLGEIIDDCLVETISDLLRLLEQGEIGVEDFKWAKGYLEKGIREDPDLNAYAATLLKDKELPLACKTYLGLAARHAEFGGKLPVSLQEEACRLASALLVRVRNGEWNDFDWDIRKYSVFCASQWLIDRNPYELLNYIFQSHWNAAAWDTLDLICEDAAKRGTGEVFRLPEALKRWHLEASYGYTERPKVLSAPRGHPQPFGDKIRNNELRHAVSLLGQVGVTKAVAYHAVAEAVFLKEGTVRNICLKPYWTLEDIKLDIERRFKSLNYPLMSGLGASSDPTPLS